MHHFAPQGGTLHAEQVSLAALADAVGTPFYCYSSATLCRHYQVFEAAFSGRPPLIAYSVKANSNQAVIATLARLGAGADVVSEGELRRALKAGVAADKIVFSGIGKTESEMALALATGVLQFNVESEPELAALDRLARAQGVRAPVALRVNPDVDAGSHDKISTGRKHDKFGIPMARARDLYREAGSMAGIEVIGVDVHIGSQLTDLAPFARAFGHVAELVAALRADGHDIRHVDLGGGLGIPYDDEVPPHPDDYARVIDQAVGSLDCRVIVEPGRLLVGNAGVLVARVVYVKETEERTFVILDAAMNDLLRPALYQAWHRIEAVATAADDAPLRPVDVVGPVCESGDTFAVQRPLPPLAAGDLVAVHSVGAYGAVMTSTYNSRLPAPEVMVNGDRWSVIRPRPTYDSLIGQDALPDWLADAERPRPPLRATAG